MRDAPTPFPSNPLSVWHQAIGEEWVSFATVVQEIMQSNEKENVAGSDEENDENNLYETLPGTLQITLKEKPHSFSIHIGKALDKPVYTCFGSENFSL